MDSRSCCAHLVESTNFRRAGSRRSLRLACPPGRSGLTRGPSGSDGGDGDWQHLGGRVTQRVNCCSGNRLWQEPPAGGSGLFAAQPKVLQLTMSVEEQEEVKGGERGRLLVHDGN